MPRIKRLSIAQKVNANKTFLSHMSHIDWVQKKKYNAYDGLKQILNFIF